MNFNSAFPSSNGKPSGGIHNFDTAEPAPDFAPVPAGIYIARVRKGEVCQTKTGADAYRLRFEIVEGEQRGKIISRIWSFSERALPYARRDLSKFGLTSSAKLLTQFPEPGREYLVRLVVALQCGGDGREFNDIKRIEIVRVDESPVATFVLPPLPPPPPGSLFGNRADKLPD